jgi:hypothetical protein
MSYPAFRNIGGSMRHLSLALVALLGLTTGADAFPSTWFRAVNGAWVQPETPRKFYVPWNGDSGPEYFFCSAGDYVVRRLGMPLNTRIFRLSEPPRKPGEGIWFSLDPEGAASRTGITNILASGPENSLSASASRSFCDVFFFR